MHLAGTVFLGEVPLAGGEQGKYPELGISRERYSWQGTYPRLRDAERRYPRLEDGGWVGWTMQTRLTIKHMDIHF